MAYSSPEESTVEVLIFKSWVPEFVCRLLAWAFTENEYWMKTGGWAGPPERVEVVDAMAHRQIE
jgi:hypothetical protein